MYFAVLAARVLLLLPLIVAISNPRVAYLPAEPADEEAPTDSSLLLPNSEGVATSAGLSTHSESTKYGTFRQSRSLFPTGSSPTTRTPTPAPSTARVPQPKVSSYKCLLTYL